MWRDIFDTFLWPGMQVAPTIVRLVEVAPENQAAVVFMVAFLVSLGVWWVAWNVALFLFCEIIVALFAPRPPRR